MLILSKKYYFILSGLFVAFFILISFLNSAQAAAPFAPQVKVADKPAVYFLSRRNHLKKTYINATAYLSYGNHWSDIKTVSADYLASWPEAKLFRAIGTPNIYYIKGNRKTLISRPADLIKFNLVGVPVIEVSQIDLAQYQTVANSVLALGSSSNSNFNSGSNSSYTKPDSGNPSPKNYLSLSSQLISGPNNNALVPGTNDNLIGVFTFEAPTEATITALSLDLKGIYNSQLINNFEVYNANNIKYHANVSWRSSNRQIIISFPKALTLSASETLTIKLLVNLNTCATDCNNQTLHLSLANAKAVEASLPVQAAFPLKGTQFKLVSSANILGKIQAQVTKLASSSLVVTSGSRLISEFSLSESSGHEDVIIKSLSFNNKGSANKNDWDNFSLWANNQVIARTPILDSQGEIVFNINYLRVPSSSTINLKVEADLTSDYNPKATYNLQLTDLNAIGSTYKLTLKPSINNINEVFSLN